jgi:hypothetical protein
VSIQYDDGTTATYEELIEKSTELYRYMRGCLKNPLEALVVMRMVERAMLHGASEEAQAEVRDAADNIVKHPQDLHVMHGYGSQRGSA